MAMTELIECKGAYIAMTELIEHRIFWDTPVLSKVISIRLEDAPWQNTNHGQP